MTALIDFEWQRDSAGYHIEKRQAPHGAAKKLPDGMYDVVVGNGGPPDYYRPLDDEPSLFAILAATEPNAEGVKGFVERFGFLTDDGPASGNPLLWQPDIRSMRVVVDQLMKGNHEAIAKAFNKSTQGDLNIKFDFVHGRSRPVLSLAPKDLKAALWLQVAQHVSGDHQLRLCLHCGTGFVFGSGTGRRRSGHYCSDRCRKAAHAEKKKG